MSRLALWPAAGVALLALGWWETRHGTGWGALVSAGATIAFAEAARIEKAGHSHRAATFGYSPAEARSLPPFRSRLAGAWTSYLVALLVYAAVSFFIVQHVRHSPS